MDFVELTGNPRHDKLIHLVQSKGYISNEELSSQLNVSAQTIRRDIRILSQNGFISRHHGGAGRISSLMNTEFSRRETSYIAEKTAIAKGVAEYIPDGSTLFITVGTTVEFIARALENKRNLRIITNSLRVANILYSNKNFEVMTVGGILRSHNGGIVGPNAIDFVKQLRADYLISSVGAIYSDGALLDYNLSEVAIVKAMLANSRSFILVADHTKFRSSAAIEIANIKDITVFFTSAKPPQSISSLLKENQIELHIAKL